MKCSVAVKHEKDGGKESHNSDDREEQTQELPVIARKLVVRWIR